MPKADPAARAAYNKAWRKRNSAHLLQYKRDRYDPAIHAAHRRKRLAHDPLFERRIKIKHKYGISLEEFDAILHSQEDCCAGCFKTTPGGLGWTVHHSHRTGKILAILCNLCNGGSGMLGDDPIRLRRLADINEELHG